MLAVSIYLIPICMCQLKSHEKLDELIYNVGYLSLIDEKYYADVNTQNSGKSNAQCWLYLPYVHQEQNHFRSNKAANMNFGHMP